MGVKLMDKQVILTEHTLVPLGVIAVLIGGIAWLTTLYADTKNNGNTLLRIEQKQDTLEDGIYQELKAINTRLSMIEGRLQKGSK